MVRLKRWVPLLIVILFFSSCYYDNLEELHPNISGTCDTTGTISYANDIVPILATNCGTNNSCHDGSSNATVHLNTYAAVQTQAFASNSTSCSGLLVLSVKHDPCLSAAQFMPQGGGMLDNCTIMKIEAWVSRGALNN